MLTEADGLVQELLTNKKESELHGLLKEALKAELEALVLAKADCFGLFEEVRTSKEQICLEAFEDIAYAIIKLVEASLALETDKSKTVEIATKLRQTIFHEQTNHSKNYTNEAYAMGREVLSIMR
ncbi:hypothetical protein Q1695_003398 [Nippostrongylus brasiliensis]|nr:hypothetical protein Q1695_003398 [Nippostrongylus brasiliensis]